MISSNDIAVSVPACSDVTVSVIASNRVAVIACVIVAMNLVARIGGT